MISTTRFATGLHPWALAPALVLALALARPAAAQPEPSPTAGTANWGLYDAVGYSGLGFGLGLALAWGMEGSGFGPPGEALAVVGAGTVVGLVTGAIIGHRAGRSAAEGRGVGSGSRAAALGGVVLAGTTLGALAAVPLINGGGEGTPLGSDERTVGLMVLAGSAVGTLVAWQLADDLPAAQVDVAPAVGAGGYGLRVRMEF